MTRVVYACADCGAELDRSTDECPQCAGPVERVDPVLVALADAIEAVLRS